MPLFIGSTSPNAREVVQRLKFIQDIGGDGTLLGVPYYDAQSPDYIVDFYSQIAEMFPKLAILIYHNPVNHKVKIPVSVFPRLVKYPNIIGMKDSHRDTREFVRLMEIIRGKISVMTNQAQMFPYYRMGSSGCWSIDAWMGPWPVLYLRNLVRAGKDHEALQIITEIMSAAGGERPGGNEGATAKLPIEFAGYVKPGPARTPIVKFSESAIERAKRKPRGGKTLRQVPPAGGSRYRYGESSLINGLCLSAECFSTVAVADLFDNCAKVKPGTNALIVAAPMDGLHRDINIVDQKLLRGPRWYF